MTDSPTPSLIQQRMALQRDRAIATCGLVISAIGIVSVTMSLFTATEPWLPIVQSVLWATILTTFAVRRRAAQRRIREFEAEHGPDAGRQDPVR